MSTMMPLLPANTLWPASPRLPAHTLWPAARRRRGSALVYVTATLVAMLAFVSLAVDLGHVFLVRSELQAAADAAARYGVTGIAAGVATAQTYAVNAAKENKSDGGDVVINL